MRHPEIAPAFAQAITFPDIDAAVIAAEDRPARSGEPAAWESYMRKFLPVMPRRDADAHHGFAPVRIAPMPIANMQIAGRPGLRLV